MSSRWSSLYNNAWKRIQTNVSDISCKLCYDIACNINIKYSNNKIKKSIIPLKIFWNSEFRERIKNSTYILNKIIE